MNNNVYHELTFLEWILPLTIINTIIFIFIIYKNKINENIRIDKTIRYALGFILAVMFSMHFILLWTKDNTISINDLPMHLCSISMILSIILAFTKNKKIYDFVIYTGFLGGLVSLLFPYLGYSFQYFRYYQFMIGHGLIILIPLYFMIIHSFIPTFKSTFITILILQIFYILIIIFNTLYDTSYMYVRFGEIVGDEKLIKTLGGTPWYLFSIEAIGIISILTWYFIIYSIFNNTPKLPQTLIHQNSAYISKKKTGRFTK